MKNILLYFFFILLFSCKEPKEQTPYQVVKEKKVINEIIKPNYEELKIWDTIFKLPEVKDRIKYVHEVTNGKRNLQVLTYSKPNKENNYYWIKVSEDNGITTVAHFNFFVYPNTEIKYFDTVTDSILTLEEWRKH